MTDLRDRLRDLPSFPGDLAILDPDAVPGDPLELFRSWLDDAIASGERQPHAMTVTTIDDNGRASHRTLIVKDVDERGIQVSSSRSSRKGAHLAERPWAGMLFFWRELGRQVELTGPVTALPAEESAADWRERPSYDGVDNPDWQVWTLAPTRAEFLQATHDRRHTRVEYVRDGETWTHRPLRASEAVR
ncbi:pyridoxamine 5'-phosphate oxidase family protein [Microbacterium betulae]|uniref:Pyridoxamine 5'-phosphate oxidase family protein n=1 Tax=Microbacterium betulae TaxID=2981139 RepID=A0AA97FGX5_9MICO|nr:pyridoxamine 5'-phosphate oxidase family protein [Microbacterium sp. AB]WOF22693.1 pyridoxamine 5'-phosphate oxidase family protein [Microbacterium sp. AB]